MAFLAPTADVHANGNELLTDFEPGTVTDPTQLISRHLRPVGDRG